MLVNRDLGASAGGEAGWGSAAALLLVRVRVKAEQDAAAAGVALRLEEDVPGGRGCVASGREAGAGGGVVEAAVPGETENADLRAVKKVKVSARLSTSYLA
jgi:hypothetical protein